MKNKISTKIIQLLKEIELKENIKILFAIESGSRVWRLESKNSDYDVRFVFYQKIEDYLTLNNNRDKVINHTQDEIDLCGFDIYKYCDLLLKSNPTAIEWLQADIIYLGKQPESLKKIAFGSFNQNALYYHYKSMCKQNYEKYLASKNLVTYKKYLYAMRGLINARWVEKTGKLPKISLVEQIEDSKSSLPKEIIKELKETIQIKKTGEEKDIIQNIVKYDLFIEDFLRERKDNVLVGSSPSKKKIEEFIIKTIKEG
jgi:predicted nucleotidyltransferase